MSRTFNHRLRGITLLEVLISLGILSVGLASVVALVPAGGDQAKKAIIEDRRGALGPNALADFVNRGVLDPATWSPPQPAAAVYSLVFDPIPTDALSPAGMAAVTAAGFTAGPLADEIFRAQDDLSYKLPDDEDAPALPQFFPGGSKRLSEGNFSWLATLAPLTSGSAFHKLSVITMYRRGETMTGAASFPTGLSTGPLVTITPPTGALQKEDVPRFFSPGAVVLLTNGAGVHEWRKVVMAAPDPLTGVVATIDLTLERDAPSGGFTTFHTVEGANGLYERVVRLEEMSPWSQ